ncbi:MAG: hypothetical protein UV05_C0056G0005 [candidate division CPR1 bacterium GW2011_GWA2_42_17]|uniref:Uncharacterized protein n=1 Tax=candidate division CPR1 bacterium GW2011_GWA2_42_17 TaxID=1618341 RepID=A0A0G1B4R6_9BACT|nr:MAG: hypothetical protein UV05_C0056G0005 [candidate division CPR1 bacterium GW2011_GWA2_42_17]
MNTVEKHESTSADLENNFLEVFTKHMLWSVPPKELYCSKEEKNIMIEKMKEAIVKLQRFSNDIIELGNDFGERILFNFEIQILKRQYDELTNPFITGFQAATIFCFIEN